MKIPISFDDWIAANPDLAKLTPAERSLARVVWDASQLASAERLRRELEGRVEWAEERESRL